MDIIKEIKNSWGWCGIDPIAIVDENEFGNLMIEDSQGKYWRLCPEDLYCEIVANNREELNQLATDQEFLEDWYMQALVEQAKAHLGQTSEDRKYCLAIPGVLGGEYSVSNVKSSPLSELVRFSGSLAEQIRDLPDGTQVKLEVVD